MEIREERFSERLLAELTALSRDWEAEESCRGYRANGREDVEGRRIFCARDGDRLVGYLFGVLFSEEKGNSVVERGQTAFELEELYVVPDRRSQGLGRALYAAAEEALRGEARVILLSTATKDFRRILHFYLEELGMDFWSARLFKEIGGGRPPDAGGKAREDTTG